MGIVLRCVLSGFLIFGMTGCAYKGNIREGFYHPVNPKEKLPYKIAVVADGKFKAARYRWNDVGPCEMSLQPALMEALKEQFSALFKEVVFVEDPKKPEGADFLVFPSLGSSNAGPAQASPHNAKAEKTVFIDDPGTLQISIKDAKTNKAVAFYSNSSSLQVFCPFLSCGVPVILSIYSLCLLCPATIPWALHGSGIAGREELERAVKINLETIAKKMQNDKRTLAARGQLPLSENPKNSPAQKIK